jgi:N utilization substance protein B
MKRRSKARIWALQIIYTWEILGGDPVGITESHLNQRKAGEKGREYTRKLVSKIKDELPNIDSVLEKTLTAWPIERLSIVDKNILRIGACELLYFSEIPRAVVIDEAIKLADLYGGVESARFINGILDSIAMTTGEGECITE